MADKNTTGEPCKAAEITDDEINAAVDAVLAKPETGQYPLGGGYQLDLAAAVEAPTLQRASHSREITRC